MKPRSGSPRSGAGRQRYRTISRAASTFIAMSASMNWTAWNVLIDSPKLLAGPW